MLPVFYVCIILLEACNVFDAHFFALCSALSIFKKIFRLSGMAYICNQIITLVDHLMVGFYNGILCHNRFFKRIIHFICHILIFHLFICQMIRRYQNPADIRIFVILPSRILHPTLSIFRKQGSRQPQSPVPLHRFVAFIISWFLQVIFRPVLFRIFD